jgi:hypothetical protein
MITNDQKLFINFYTFNNFKSQNVSMVEESESQILEQKTPEPTLKNSSKYNKWFFFSGVALSCVGESALIGYVVFSYNNISSMGFSMALVLLAVGNMIMLAEDKLENLAVRLFKTRG